MIKKNEKGERESSFEYYDSQGETEDTVSLEEVAKERKSNNEPLWIIFSISIII